MPFPTLPSLLPAAGPQACQLSPQHSSPGPSASWGLYSAHPGWSQKESLYSRCDPKGPLAPGPSSPAPTGPGLNVCKLRFALTTQESHPSLDLQTPVARKAELACRPLRLGAVPQSVAGVGGSPAARPPFLLRLAPCSRRVRCFRNALGASGPVCPSSTHTLWPLRPCPQGRGPGGRSGDIWGRDSGPRVAWRGRRVLSRPVPRACVRSPLPGSGGRTAAPCPHDPGHASLRRVARADSRVVPGPLPWGCSSAVPLGLGPRAALALRESGARSASQLCPPGPAGADCPCPCHLCVC